jgi:predicted dehydrogenase
LSSEPAAHSILYAHEHARRVRVGFIGCGDHAFRNLYPVLRYLPVDLVAVCDLRADRAESFRRGFGAERAYLDHRKMLESERLDAALIVTGYDRSGRVQHAALAADCLRRGVSAWVEKPPVNDLGDVALLREALASGGGATFAVGFKKAFAPATRKLVSLMGQAEFGALRTITLRYAQTIPPREKLMEDPPGRWRLAFLDHICHPASLLRAIGGPVRALRYARAPDGSGFATFHLASGALASLHLLASLHPRVLAERTEVNGDGASIIVENGTRVLWCPNPLAAAYAGTGKGLHYGRDPDFTGEATDGYVVWEPEWSLGQLYNKGIFLLGYYNELAHFLDAVAGRRAVEIGDLDAAEEGIRIFQAFAREAGERVELGDLG